MSDVRSLFSKTDYRLAMKMFRYRVENNTLPLSTLVRISAIIHKPLPLVRQLVESEFPGIAIIGGEVQAPAPAKKRTTTMEDVVAARVVSQQVMNSIIKGSIYKVLTKNDDGTISPDTIVMTTYSRFMKERMLLRSILQDKLVSAESEAEARRMGIIP